MSNGQLPPELYRTVIEAVEDHQVLYQLLFVSRSFKLEAERWLYRAVNLSGTKQPRTKLNKPSVVRSYPALPQVSKHIQTLIINCTTPNLTEPDWLGFADAYRIMVNLKSLLICSPPIKMIPVLLDPTLPFQLHKFSCPFEARSKDFVQLLATFFEVQSELKDLHLFDNPSRFKLIPSALPKVSTVLSGDDLIRKLTPGRSISRVRSICNTGSPKSSQGIIGIQVLSIVQFPSLPNYAKSFPSLKFLDCRLSKNTKIMSYLSQMPLLEKLKFKFEQKIDSLDMSFREPTTFIPQAFVTCKLLREVEVGRWEGPEGHSTSLSWVRDVSAPLATIWDDAEWKHY